MYCCEVPGPVKASFCVRPTFTPETGASFDDASLYLVQRFRGSGGGVVSPYHNSFSRVEY